jgi:8-oxo-dGTP pyrophosphatase MutT (NUDIX family)
LLVKVKRPHLNKYFYEFLSGSLKSKKEKPLKAAKRELIEEPGVYIRKNTKFIKLPSIYSMADRL